MAVADAAAADLPAGLVYAGFSWGVPHAQRLAQTRAGAKGALLYESCIPISGEWAFGPWPQGVPVQIHGMDQDEFFAKEGDLDAAREIVETLGPDLAELYTYPGDAHLFADRTLPTYDAEAAGLLTQRSWRSSTASRRPRCGTLPAWAVSHEWSPPSASPPCWPSSGCRAAPPSTTPEGDAEVMATGLDVPWGLGFEPEGSALVAERPTGRIYRIPAGAGSRSTSAPFLACPTSARAGCSGWRSTRASSTTG